MCIRDSIVEAARELYEERGLSRTTVKDITQRVGVTRSLFYHYFSDKDAVTEAVLDDIVEDFLEALRYWNAGRERGNVDKALTDCLRIFRNGIFESGSFRRSLANTENSALYLHFVQTVADRVARYIVDSTVRDFERFHNVEIEHVYETFYMMIVGMTGLIRANPHISDDVVKRIVAQTLHIEGYLDGGAQGAGSVSYTHLDVYKRQAGRHDLGDVRGRALQQQGEHDDDGAGDNADAREDHA